MAIILERNHEDLGKGCGWRGDQTVIDLRGI